jgi:hypothetical protein
MGLFSPGVAQDNDSAQKLWGALSVPPIQQRPQPLGYLPLLIAADYTKDARLCQPYKEKICSY